MNEYEKGFRDGQQSVLERVERMKRPIWHQDVNRHLENVARHNLIDEILSANLTDKEV